MTSISVEEFTDLISKVRACAADERLADATALLHHAISLDPENSSLFVWLGWLKLQAGDYPGALNQGLGVEDVDGSQYVATRRLVVFAGAMSGDWDRVDTALAELEAVSPELADALAQDCAGQFWMRIANRYSQRQFHETIRLYAALPRLIRRSSRDMTCRMALLAANALMELRRHSEAPEVLRAASSDVVPKNINHPAAPFAGVVLITSLMPGRIDIQRQAIASWQRCGARIISINAADEAEAIGRDYPDVDFIYAYRDARAELRKPYIYLQDIMKALAAQPETIVGIINSDIVIDNDSDAALRTVASIGETSLVYGCRYEVPSLLHRTDHGAAEAFSYGYDWFLFPKTLAAAVDVEPFVFGCPWWDLWFPFAALVTGAGLVQFERPLAYHQTHGTNWSEASFMSFGNATVSKIRSMDAARSASSAVHDGVRIVQACDESMRDHVDPAIFFGWVADALRTVLRQASGPNVAVPIALA
jgi:tetratricopeptide (TPR) repeat protein